MKDCRPHSPPPTAARPASSSILPFIPCLGCQGKRNRGRNGQPVNPSLARWPTCMAEFETKTSNRVTNNPGTFDPFRPETHGPRKTFFRPRRPSTRVSDGPQNPLRGLVSTECPTVSQSILRTGLLQKDLASRKTLGVVSWTRSRRRLPLVISGYGSGSRCRVDGGPQIEARPR